MSISYFHIKQDETTAYISHIVDKLIEIEYKPDAAWVVTIDGVTVATSQNYEQIRDNLDFLRREGKYANS